MNVESTLRQSSHQEILVLLPSLAQINHFVDDWIRPSVEWSDVSKFFGLLTLAVRASHPLRAIAMTLTES